MIYQLLGNSATVRNMSRVEAAPIYYSAECMVSFPVQLLCDTTGQARPGYAGWGDEGRWGGGEVGRMCSVLCALRVGNHRARPSSRQTARQPDKGMAVAGKAGKGHARTDVWPDHWLKV